VAEGARVHRAADDGLARSARRCASGHATRRARGGQCPDRARAEAQARRHAAGNARGNARGKARGNARGKARRSAIAATRFRGVENDGSGECTARATQCLALHGMCRAPHGNATAADSRGGGSPTSLHASRAASRGRSRPRSRGRSRAAPRAPITAQRAAHRSDDGGTSRSFRTQPCACG
jgi:hypothetical protein